VRLCTMVNNFSPLYEGNFKIAMDELDTYVGACTAACTAPKHSFPLSACLGSGAECTAGSAVYNAKYMQRLHSLGSAPRLPQCASKHGIV
jgi:hypothetical protein